MSCKIRPWYSFVVGTGVGTGIRTGIGVGLSLALAIGLAGFGRTVRGEEGRSIFDGRSLKGWKGDRHYWKVEEGAIVGRTTADRPLKHNTFLIYEGPLVRDFEWTLQFKIEGGNSGVQYRSRVLPEKRAGQYVVAGYQADIDASGRYTGICYEERGRGILAERGLRVVIGADGSRKSTRFADAAALARVVRRGDWNDYRIVARGPRIRQYINGKLMCEIIDRDRAHASASGILALQLHKGPPMVVRFRRLRLKTLGPSSGRSGGPSDGRSNGPPSDPSN